MKKLAEYINEAYEVNFRDRVQPKTTSELKQIIKDAFNHNIYNLNFIDTSKITDMSFLFYTYINGNLDVSKLLIALIPLFEFTIPSQLDFTALPNGETIPMPVITTLLFSIFYLIVNKL